MIIYYENNTGNSSSSVGTSDFLLGSELSYHNSLSTLVDKYISYYIQHDTLEEWEYGLGFVEYTGGEYILVRGGSSVYSGTTIYSSSNANSKVNFSAGTKSVTSSITSERVIHGFNNVEHKQYSFYVNDTVQSVYAVTTSGSDLTAYLPQASGNKNLLIGFKLTEGSTNDLIINPSGSDLIDGFSSTTLTPALKYTSLISDGSGWIQLNDKQDLSTVGTPQGLDGTIQYKYGNEFLGDPNFVWDSGNSLLMIGGSTSGTADIILDGSGSYNTVFNQQALNVDFQVKGTGTTNQLYFDASSGRLGVNTSSPTSILHVVGRCANENFKLESTSNCPTGVGLTLYHNPQGGSSVDDIPGFINLAGRNSNGQRVNYGKISSKILGTTINSTSGEIVISVDHNGLDTNVINASPQKTSIGLGADTSYLDNISIGNFVINSGDTSVVVGHNSVLNSGSVGSFILSNNGDLTGSDSVLVASSVASSGDSLVVIGSESYASGDNNFVIGKNNELVGQGSLVLGQANVVSGNNSLIYGNNSSVAGNSGVVIGNDSTNTSGLIIGSSVSNTGNNTVIGNDIEATGLDNHIVGSQIHSTGNNNFLLGESIEVDGSGNMIFGTDITSTGNNNILIGQNLTLDRDENIVLGYGSEDLVINSDTIAINSGLSVSNINIYSNSASSGIFIAGNKVGINTLPTGNYVFDIAGSGKIEDLYAETFRLGSSAVSGSVLVTDDQGFATWQASSDIAEEIVADLLNQAIVTYDGTNLVPTSGLYWNSSSGVLYTENSNNVIPVGNNSFVLNNSKASRSNLFNIKGSARDDLFLVSTVSDRIGVNVTTPARTVDVSGTFRVSNNSQYYLDKTDNSFTIAYDNGVAQNNRFNFTPSGLYVSQTSTSPQVLPLLNYGVSYPTTTNTQYTRMLIFDESVGRVVYVSTLTSGFDAFTGTSDN